MPQTIWNPKEGETATLYTERSAGKIYYHCGLVPDADHYRAAIGAHLRVETSDDGVAWSASEVISDASVFQWCEWDLATPGNYVRVTALDGDTVISEIGLVSEYFGGVTSFTVDSESEGAEFLNDEQEMVPEYISYENSGYFDEVYHPRTAYEHLIQLEPYENSHPPLGKYIISLGILMFGLNPFGWRFMGTLFGVLMLPVLYHLTKRLFGQSWLSAFSTALFALDFMHFTQTRLATIDTYAVFFILLMYDAMVCFVQKDLLTCRMRECLVPLGLSGVLFGLGAASKWTVIYGGAGLAVLFFAKLIVTIKSAWKEKEPRALVWKRSIQLCLWCLLLFVAIPFGIYFASYLPMTMLPHNVDNIWGNFWNYQTNMFNYHSQLQATHPFSSPWYEWPVIKRPIWYSSENLADGAISTIVCLGNPFIWWLGLAAMLCMLVVWLRKPRMLPGIILTGYASVYVPWMLVPRLTFIYHYFTAVPFIILAITWFAYWLVYEKNVSAKVVFFACCGYAMACAVLFAWFFPALSGLPTTYDYTKPLHWFKSWRF